jgi:hypothetical protein
VGTIVTVPSAGIKVGELDAHPAPSDTGDYFDSTACDWTPEEIDFVDWVFNASPVLKMSSTDLAPGLPSPSV